MKTDEVNQMDSDWAAVEAGTMELSDYIDKWLDELYEQYTQGGDGSMPYGIMCGDTGTPDEWLFEKLEGYLR
jgi:hypothetical protein